MTLLKATPGPEPLQPGLRQPKAWLPGLVVLVPALLLAACAPSPQVEVEPPLPKVSNAQSGAEVSPEGPTLAPLATPQQVVRAVDVGRRDPFAAVLTPRLIGTPAPSASAGAAAASKPMPPLAPPKGLVFQGVLQGPGGQEALVDYAPGSEAAGTRSGSLRVGDVGTGQGDSLLPPGWRVQAIDVDRGVLVLQAGKQSVSLVL